MIIESDQINIKDLLIDEPQVGKDSWFDPERDLTVHDWQQMTKKLKDHEVNRREVWIDLARPMMILSPTKMVHLFTEERAWEFARSRESSFDMPGRAGPQFQTTDSDIFEQAFNLRVLCPHKIGQINMNWIKVESLMRRITHRTAASTLKDNLMMRSAIKLLYPEKEVASSSGIKATVGIYLDRGRERDDWEQFLVFAALARLLDSQIIESLDLTNKDKDQMKDYVEMMKNFAESDNTWEFFARQAAYLAMISAQEIKINDDGLQLIWSQKTEKKDAELPEWRSF